jgi:PhoPQ-activated pathogenicity-related protein
VIRDQGIPDRPVRLNTRHSKLNAVAFHLVHNYISVEDRPMRFLASRLLALAVAAGLPQAARCDLNGYVGKNDKTYAWEKRSEIRQGGSTVVDLHMTSQRWQGITWEHRILVFLPEKVDYPETCTLYVTGGNGSESDRVLGRTIANATGMPLAILFNIPNQPLFEGLSEDALIAYTFDRYLETGDETWPLLFPMTKSAVRAMDTLQAWAQKDSRPAIKKFVVAGGSKRGWTTWLTAATGDGRVKGIVPIVYDNLNLSAQMPHQITTWGKYSEQIEDYSRRGLQQKMSTERGKKLNAMVDPYNYRKSLGMPKLIVNGTNDPYWTLEALNLYWDQLSGPKQVLYGANSGHGMEKSLPAVLAATAAFSRSVASGKPLPPVTWQYRTENGGLRLAIKAGPAAKTARLWTATSDTKDFRKSTWSAQSIDRNGEEFIAPIGPPSSGYLAVFGEVTMEAEGRTYPVSTQVRIVEAKR